MKTIYIKIATVAILLSAVCVQTSTAQGLTSIGAKYHQKHSNFDALPYDDEDISVGIAYEQHTQDSFWQIAVEYAWDAKGIETTDFIITPQLNLLWKDGPWYGGMGILTSYIEDEDAGDDWLDPYWQGILGIRVPFMGGNIALAVHYEFDAWDELNEFDVDDLAYGAWLNVAM